MGCDGQAVAGWKTDLALWPGAWRNRYHQLQPLSIGWIAPDTEAMRNVIQQGDCIRTRFRAKHPRTLWLNDNDPKINTGFMLHCNMRMAALRTERWRSRRRLISSDQRSNAPPPAGLRVSGDPFLLPGAPDGTAVLLLPAVVQLFEKACRTSSRGRLFRCSVQVRNSRVKADRPVPPARQISR